MSSNGEGDVPKPSPHGQKKSRKERAQELKHLVEGDFLHDLPGEPGPPLSY